MPNIHEVAKQAGVSTATVSRTFNTPDLLNAQTQQRVLEAARQLNYRPSRSRARKGETALQRTGGVQGTFLGFQFFSFSPTDVLQSNSFYGPILAGAQTEAAAHGMHLLLHTTDRHQMAQGLPKMIGDQAIAGMLLVGTADPEILTAFLEHVPQIVLVDNVDATGRHDCIVSDGLGGALTATRYLFELGHRRIAFLLDDPQIPSFQDRLRGFVCAHFERGLTVTPEMIVTTPTGGTVEDALRAFFARSDRPTALVSSNDMNAAAAIQICRELGIGIPEDLSLIGFDDIALSDHLWRPLTTVRVNKELMGRMAVSRLLTRLQAPDSNLETMPPVRIQIPVSLVERQSCRRIDL